MVQKQSLFAVKLAGKKKRDCEADIQKLLDAESYKDFIEAMKKPGLISNGVLVNTLKEFGYDIPASTLYRWRLRLINGVTK
jgi:hypothetical protein